jgi:hypothetical protein
LASRIAAKRASRRAISAGTSIPSIGLLGQAQQLLDLRLQLCLDLVRVPVTERSVLARVGLDLGAIQAHVAYLQQLQGARHLQDLHEQILQLRQEPLAKRRDRVVIGMRVGRDEPKRHRVIGRPLDATAGELPRGVPVEQQRQQHRRRKRRHSATRVLPVQLREVQLLDRFHNEARQVILGQPFLHRRRQQIRRVPIDLNESAHRRARLMRYADDSMLPGRRSLAAADTPTDS